MTCLRSAAAKSKLWAMPPDRKLPNGRKVISSFSEHRVGGKGNCGGDWLNGEEPEEPGRTEEVASYGVNGWSQEVNFGILKYF